MVRRAQAALRSVEHTSVRQLRVLAAIVFLFAMVIATVAPAVTAPMAFADSSTSSSSSSSSSSVDYATWAEVSKAMDKQLNSGLKTYKDGNTAGATSDFMGAYNKIYVASNFTAVVHDTIGADKQLAQQQAFQSVQNLSYTPSNDDQLAQQIDALTADLDATAQLAKERKELDAKKKKNPGKGNRSWTDVANEMTPILDNAYKAYEKGDGAKGATLVNNAYYQYYEKLGFEKNVMNAISGNRVSQVEYQFKMCRKSMNAGASLKDTKKLIDDLKAMLIKDAGILDGGAADKEDGFTKLVTSSSGQAFLVLIREGLEALLVVAAIVAYLVKSDNKRFVKWIYLGVLVGLLGAGLVAVIFVFAFGGSGPIQEIMEGTCALIAMGMLLWTSNWMLNKSSVEAWNRYIRKKTEAAVAAASADNVTLKTVVSLAMLSFLAVFREGAETVIFYESIYTMSRDTRGMWIGGLTAAVVLVGIFLLFRFTSVKIPIGPFFLVTSILMSVLVVVFAGGVHSLIEGDLLPAFYLNGVPTNDWLGLYPYVECLVAQAIAAVAVIALFVVGFIKQRKLKAQATVEVPAVKA
jgi:high-affinity iron transporter